MQTIAHLVITISFLISIVFAIYVRCKIRYQTSSTCAKAFRWMLILFAAALIPYTIMNHMVWSATVMIAVIFLGNLIYAIVDICMERKYRVEE